MRPKQTVLIVDSNPEIGFLLGVLLRGHGINPVIAQSTESACARIKSSDVVVCDPGFYATINLEEIKEQCERYQVPLVLMTTVDKYDHPFVIQKPFDLEMFLRVVFKAGGFERVDELGSAYP